MNIKKEAFDRVVEQIHSNIRGKVSKLRMNRYEINKLANEQRRIKKEIFAWVTVLREVKPKEPNGK